MTTNPEYPTTSEVHAGSVPPGFVIDLEAPETIASQLLLDEIWLLRRPATRLLALRRFIDQPGLVPEDSVWHRLTSKETCNYYGFDKQTETAIERDPFFQHLTDHSQHGTGLLSGSERTLRVRFRRLEIFLERAKVAKTLGKVSLQKAE